MTGGERESIEQRVLVLALTAKDAELTRGILERADVACVSFTDLDHLCEQIARGAGAVLLPEEALTTGRHRGLIDLLALQPPWSDLPMLILARAGAGSAALAQAMEILGNVTVLERPTRVAALVSAVRTALRGRQRQYQIRDHLNATAQGEKELRRSAELLSVLIDRSPFGFYLVDADFRISHVNADSQARAFRSVVPVVGRRLDEVMRILWPEPLATDLIAIFRETLNTGIPYLSPGLVSPRRDLGDVESYEWQLERITLPDGRYGVVCYYFDTTRLREAEQARRDSEARFRNLADNIPQLAWIADPGTGGQIHWFNQNWFDYTGTTLEEMHGLGWQTVHHPDHAERVTRKFAEHVQACLDWEDIFPLRGKDGEFRWFLSRMKVIRDESGTVVQIFGTNTDITEQRQTANELRRVAAELAETDRRKDEFLAMLAHELRNPLAPIHNAVQILRLPGNSKEAVRAASEMMERQVGQMVRLVDDLLDVSRISRGKVELRREPIALASAVNHGVEAVGPFCVRMGHELVVTMPAEPIYLIADLTRVAQVVGNLLTNACKFTDRGGRIELLVSVEPRTPSEHTPYAVLRVRDNGIGIAAEQLSHIFDLFTQLDTSLERSQSGLGIGLTLVKSIVELHGGTVTVHSAGIGQGSEFVVRLPIIGEATTL